VPEITLEETGWSIDVKMKFYHDLIYLEKIDIINIYIISHKFLSLGCLHYL
jgi:hypothetical protein